MTGRSSKFEVRSARGITAPLGARSSGGFSFCVAVASWVLLSLCPALATSLDPQKDIPSLQPPHGEIPLTFWEQYGPWVALGGVLVVALVGAGIWLLLRPKPAVVAPPEVTARRELETLRRQPENGMVLSRVSQVVRHYFSAAFGLASGELTTTEFCRAVGGAEQVGAELSGAVGQFLRECDERKFSPAPPPAPANAVPKAFELLAQAETRRAQLREAATRESAASGPAPGGSK
jgi:hypothetical protein